MIKNLEITDLEISLDEIRSSGNPNVLYGGGWAAVLAIEFLRKNSIEIDAVVVDIGGIKSKGPKVEDYKLISPEDLSTRFDNINLICGFYTKKITQDFSTKSERLQHLGVSVRPYLFDLHLMMYPERRFSYDWIVQNDSEFDRVAEKLCDQLSRDTLKAFLEQRVGMCYGPLEPLVVPNQYFTETVYSLNNHEVLLDCGAFDGDTILDFKSSLKRQIGRVSFDKIIAFEPNKEPFKLLLKNTSPDFS